MDVFSSSDVRHLPSAIIDIKAKNGLNASSSVGSTPVIDFEIPPSLGYYLAENVYLSFELELSSADAVVYNLRAQENGGVGGLLSAIHIYSYDGTLLEEIVDYNVLNNVVVSHMLGVDREGKDGMAKRLGITEAFSGNYDPVVPLVTPNALPIDPTVLITQKYQKQKIQLPLRLSALLSQSSIIPVNFLNGLRIRLLCNRPEQWLIVHGDDVNTASETVDANNPAIESALGTLIGTNAVGDWTFSPLNNAISIPADQNIFSTGSTNNTIKIDALADIVLPAEAYTQAAFVAALDPLLTASAAGVTCVVGSTANSIVIVNATGAPIDLSGTLLTVLLDQAGNTPITVADAAQTGDLTLIDQAATVVAGPYATAAAQTAIDTALALISRVDTALLDATAGAQSLSLTNNGTSDLTLQGVFATNFIDETATNPVVIAGGGVVTGPMPINKRGGGGGVEGLYFRRSSLYLNNHLAGLNSCPFKVDQKITIKNDLGNYIGESPPITSIGIQALPVTGGSRIYVDFNATWNNDTAVLCSGRKFVKSVLPATGIEYSMTNISLQVPIVSVPANYQKALSEAVVSPEGMVMDMKAYQVVRTNVTTGTALSNNALPFIATKAKGIISIPYVVSNSDFQTQYCANNLSPLRMTKTWYQYENVRHPERMIETDKTRQGSLDQQLLFEQQKAYNYCLGKLASFNGYSNLYRDKTFFLGRSLGQFGSVYDTINKNVVLATESTSSAGGVAEPIVFNHYASSVNQIRMVPGGVILLK